MRSGFKLIEVIALALVFLQVLKEVPRPARRRNLSIHLVSTSRSIPIASDSLFFVASPCFLVAWLVPMLLCLISLFPGFLHEVMLRFRVFGVACVDLLMWPIQARPLVFRFCLI